MQWYTRDSTTDPSGFATKNVQSPDPGEEPAFPLIITVKSSGFGKGPFPETIRNFSFTIIVPTGYVSDPFASIAIFPTEFT